MNGSGAIQRLTAFLLMSSLWSFTVTQTIEDGVNQVTALSNNLMPLFFGPLAAGQRNVVLGPFGVASNLVMLLEASNGESRQEIMRAMNVTLDDIASLRIGFQAYCRLFLQHSANSEAAGAFNSASLLVDSIMQTAYNNIINQYYCASIAENITSGSALRLESHSGVMAHWKDFEKLAVYTFLSHQDIRPFLRRDGISIPVPMIPQVGVFNTGIWESTKIIQIPLESNMVDLVVLLPERSQKVNKLASSLSANIISQIMNNLEKEELEVFIPQLTSVNKKLDLTQIVQSLGIRRIFNETTSDLSRAVDKNKPSHVDKITQDAYISTSFTSLNTVAGAASEIESSRTRSKRDANRVYLTKPFVFLVLHKETHLVLLAGKIEDPSQTPSK